jgi:hypothetical protein
MSITTTAPEHTLMQIGRAWRNRAGLTTLLATFTTVALLYSLGLASGSLTLAALMGLAAFAVYILGFAAAGIQYMDQASEREVTGTVAAFAAAPMVALRGIGLALAFALAVLAFALIAAVLLLICKIPVLGGVLLAVVFPVLTFGAALLFLSFYVVGALAAPALWNGQSLRVVLAQLWAVATQRPLEAFLQIMLLLFVGGFIAAIFAGFVMMGGMFTGGLAAGILGGGGMGGMMAGAMGGGAGNGALVFGGAAGAAIVFAVCVALLTALMMYGLALTYLKLTDGIDTEAAQASMDNALAMAKQRAQQAKQSAQATMQTPPPAPAASAAFTPDQTAARADFAPTHPLAEQPRAAPNTESTLGPVPPVLQPYVAPAVTAPAAPPRAPAEPAITVIAPVLLPVAAPVTAPAIAPATPVSTQPVSIAPPPVDDAMLTVMLPSPKPAAATQCPACHSSVQADDVFCGNCGHKLK